MKKYDYLIVGAGLYGAVMAYELGKKGKRCLVIDAGITLQVIFTVRISKAYTCTNTAHIFSYIR